MRIFDADVTGSLHVSGSSNFKGGVTVSGSQTVTGSLTVHGNAKLGDEITDTHTVTGSMRVTGSLAVTGSISGSLTGVLRTDYIDFNTGATIAGQVARMTWNDTDGTVDIGMKGGNVTLQVGQEQLTRVVNKSGINLLEATYNAVKILGAQGNRLSITLAQADNDDHSAETLGLVTENIDNNQEGYVTTSGLVRGINTTGALQGELWNDGDVLYLSPINAGGITNVKPQAPLHTVILGFVVRAHSNVGSIYVKVNNGYEIDELHNVRIDTGSLNYGDLLMWSGSVWANSKALSGSYQLTGSLNISGSQTINGNQIISGSITVTNNITVLGTSSFVYVTSSNLNLTGPFIYTNVYEPIERFGGLVVFDSGSSNATASLLWDSLNNHWIYQNASGSAYSGGMLLSGPRNTGSLGQEVGLTSTRIPKSVGGDHLDNSNIYDTGTVVKIISNSEITGSLKVTGGISGSIDYSYIQNTPTLVSGSAQINITGTTGYSAVSGSIAAALSGSWIASDGTSSDTISFGETVTITGGANSLVTFLPGSNTFVVNSSHQSVNAASTSNNSGRTYIQDIYLDSYGHITGITTATETVVDTYTTGVTFNTGDGVLTFTRSNGGTYTVDLDGRYGTSSTDYYVTGGTFNTGNGNLTLTRNDGGTIVTNLDGRYLTSHPSVSAASSSDNSGRTYIQDILLDQYGHITGITTSTETVVDTYTTGGTTNSTTGLITFTKSDGNTYTASISGYVTTQIANLVNSAPTTLDTLNELAAALGNDPNFATTISTAIGNKVSKSGDTMTGNLTAPKFITSGGTSSQFVKGDGTLDSSTYLTSYTETDTLQTVTARGSFTATPVTFNGDVTLGNSADLKFVDLGGTFPTSGKGFDWTLNNDGARIYAIQPSSDSIDFVFQLRDNATVNDRFVFHVDDYQGPAFDKYPLIIRGGTEFDLVDSALYVGGTLVLSNGRVLQNVTGNISMFTNNVGYLTAHPSVSAASSSDNSGRTYIQDILLDSFGHITGITTATETVVDTNYYTTGATFNTGNGTVTFTRNDGNTYTVNLDGRYLTAHPSVSAASSVNNSGRTYIQDIFVDSYGHITGITSATETVTDTFTTGATFNTSDGVITFTNNNGGGTFTVDIDGRFLTAESDTLATITARGNTTNQSITVSGITSYNDVVISGGTLTVYESVSGATVFAVDGTNGRLFAVTDDLSNSLFSVNTISGLPVIEAFADYSVVMGRFNQNDFYLGSTGGIGMGTTPVSGYKLAVNGIIRATAIVKLGGTSSEFLKADGSVDTNTYLTAHPSVSAASSVNNSGRTYIQDIYLDQYGHITGITSATETVTDTNYYTTGGTFNTGNGNLTYTRNDGGTYTVNLDGRYQAAGSYLTSESDTLATVTARGASTSTTLSLAKVVTTGLYGPSTSGNIPIWQYDSGNPGYGIMYYESSPDYLKIDVSGNLVTGTPDFQVSPDAAYVNGNIVWHLGNDGSGSGLDADLLDGQHGSYYYPASNPNGYITSYSNYYTTGATFNTGNGYITFTRNDGGTYNVNLDGRYAYTSHTHDDRYLPYVKNADTGSLPAGVWYTIAVNSGNRAVAQFILRDTASGEHQSVVFYATHHFGNYSDITVLINSRYSGNPFRYIRIQDGGTYDGALLQVYIDESYSQVQAWMLDNIQSSGWVMKDWVPDGTDPGGVNNFAALTTTPAQVDLDQVINGGITTTGPIFGGGDTTQYEYLNTNNYSTTTDTRYYTQSSINSFFSGGIGIIGYNKTNWDTAYSWGNHSGYGYATTGYVQTQISNLVNGAPALLDTLNELAAAIGNDANFATTITTSIGNKVSKSGDTMTGNLTFGATSGLGVFWGMNTDAAFIRFISTGNGAGQSYLEIGTQDDSDEPIWFTQSGNLRAYIATDGYFKNGSGYKYLYESGTWGIDISGNAATVSNGVYTTGSYSNPSWITSLAGSKITGNISGNASNITSYTINQNLGTSDSPTFANITVNGQYYTNTSSTRYKYSLYDSSSAYQIGMEAGNNFGGLSDWAMTFQFNNNNDRGFWWGDDAHSTSQGAMALTTNGYLTVARGIRVGYGESDTTTPTVPLQVYGSGSLVLDVQGSLGQLFSVTDTLSGSLFSVNHISGLPVLEVFSDDRVVMGSYGTNAFVVSGTTTTVSGSLLTSGSFAHIGTATINGGTVWHSGNDGSGSGLDADTLDGYHASSFLTSYTETDTLATVTARGASTSTAVTFTGGFNDGYITFNAAQINRSGGYVELQYSSGGGVRMFGAGATPITFNTAGTGIFSSSVTASSFVKSGGSSSQFLMADGSVSTNPGWITSYSETDTLATVTARGASTSTAVSFNGGLTTAGLTNNSSAVLANNTNINPNSYSNKVVAGAVGDGSWGVTTGIAGNAGTNHNWSMGHNGSNFYFGISNGSSTSLSTWMQVSPSKVINLNGYTSNGFLKTSNSDGTLTVDTNTYYLASNPNGYISSYTETDTLNSVTTRGASTTNDITIGGLTVGGSLSRGTYTSASNYVTGADNIVLKGNSVGVSGIFFESEKDGTNINHPSDFAFIQFHPYGVGGSSGESNRLVIGVSNDGDDYIVLNPVVSNGLVVRVGAGTTEYVVYHAGNIPTWNQNTTGNAATATTATNWGSYGAVPAAGTSFGNANTIGRSDGNGYTFFNYINSNTSPNENPTISQVIVTNGGDNYYRKASISHLTSAVQSNASGSWGISVTGVASQVTINYNNDSNSTYQMLWGSGNSVYGTAGVYLNPYNDYVYGASFNASDWFRSSGVTGWYNSTYGGGIYQTESTMVRVYDNRGFWIDGGNSNTVQDATLYVTATNNNDWLAVFNAYNSSKTEYGVYVRIASGSSYGYALLTDGSTWTYRVDGSGRVYAPIYYDINDTAYYLNPASTSNLGIVKLNSTASGTEVLTVDGVNGRLFTITDDLSDSLFSVNTIAGVPVIEAFSDYRVIMGRYNQNDFVLNGANGRIGMGTASPSGKLHVYSSSATDTYLESGTSGTTGKLIFKTSDNSDLNKYIMQDAYWTLVGTHSNEGFRVRDSSNTVLMTVNGTSNAYPSRVGIGNTSPSYKLHVSGDIYADGGWVRVSGNQGLYWETYDTRIFSQDSTYIRTRSDHGWIYQDRNAITKGYVYFDSDGFGFLSSDGNWWLNNVGNSSAMLVIGGYQGYNAHTSVTGRRLMFGGADTDAQGNYYIGTNKENYNGNYNKLDLRWHTGIRMGAQPSYGGIRFYNNEDLDTLIFSVGQDDANVRVTNNLYMGGNLVATQSWVNSQGFLTSVSDVWVNTSGDTMTGHFMVDYNIATPANYYSGLQAELRATSGTAGISLHRNGYSHVGIYHDSTNELKFNMNSGTVIVPYNAGTVWGSGNLTNLNQLTNGPGYLTSESDTLNSVTTRGSSTSNSITVGGLTVSKSGTNSTITFPAQTNDPGFITHYESNNSARMYFSVSDDDNTTSDYFAFGAGGTYRTVIYTNGRMDLTDVYLGGGGWFRNYGYSGLYNQDYGNHWYVTDNATWNAAGNNSSYIQIAMRTGGHQGTVRGHFYADSSNNIGILNNAGSWGIRLNSSRDTQLYGTLTVGSSTDSSIYMTDSDEGTRTIHCNSNRIGFLNQSSSWGSYCDDTGNWITDFAMYSYNWFRSYGSNGWYNETYGGGIYMTDSTWVRVYNNKQFLADNLIQSNTAMYAPIFYDSANNAYYLNPNGYSNLGTVRFNSSGANAEVVAVDGVNGRLFTVTDDMTDSIFSVNTISGLPVIEAFADYRVIMGRYLQNDFIINASGQVSIGSAAVGSYKFTVSGGQWGSYFKGGDTGTGSDIARFVDANGNTQFLVRGDGVAYATTYLHVNGINTGYNFYNNGTSYLNGAVTVDDNLTITAGYALYGNYGTWTGEGNKIQWHSNNLYFQNTGGGEFIFRNSGGSNVFRVSNAGVVTASSDIFGQFIFGSYFNASAGNSENPTIGQIWTQNTSDNYLRKSTPAHFISQLGLITTSNIGSQSVSYASTVGINYNNDSNSTYQVLWGSGNSVYGTGGVYVNPYYDYMYATAFVSTKFGIQDGTPMDCYMEVTDQNPVQDGIQYGGEFYFYGDQSTSLSHLYFGGALIYNNLVVNGRITENSSIRYKKDIAQIENGLEKVLQLSGVTYTKINNEQKEAGVIAEEVAKILPEAVGFDTEGRPDSVSYGRLTALLIEAIKDLKKEIDELKGNK